MAAIRAVKHTHAVHCPFTPAKNKKSYLKGKALPPHLFHNSLSHTLVEKGINTERIHPVQELRKALITNEIDRVKQLLPKTLELDENTQYDLTSLYHNLKSDANTKQAYDTFKRLYNEHVVEQAVLQNNPKLLQGSLAEECEIHKMSEEYVVKTLEALNNSQAKRIASEITAISNIPFKRHKLIPIDMLEVCIAAEAELKRLAGKTKVVYMNATKLNTCRACVLDPVKRTFTILSKRFGELDAEGAFKRVSDAVEVAVKNNSAVARRVAHVRNKPDEYIPSSELKYELEFGQIISWTRYKSKNRPYEKKTLILQDVYDHDLYVFTGHTEEEYRKKISLPDMIKVLEDAGKTLLRMHENGIVHRDVKAKNILYRKDADGSVHAKLIDFGHCYIPDESTHLKKRTKGYGTLRYTAPDLLENPSMKGDPLFLAKAEDAYALGQCIYEVYLQEATPWGSIAYRALKKKHNAEENKATAIRLQKEEAEWLLKESEKGPKTAEKELFRIASRLLEPKPKKRMQIPEFMSALYDLKAKYATVL